MKKITKKTEETKTRKTGEIDESTLDSTERKAIHRLAFHLAMRRAAKDLVEGKDEEKEVPSRTMHSALDEMGNPWDELFGDVDNDDELKKLFHVSSEHRIHLDDDDNDDDEDEDDEDDESAVNEFLHDHYIPNDHGKYVPRPRVKCADGYSVSIQAGDGDGIFCWPHVDTDYFTHVMMHHPTVLDEELLPYRMDLNDEHEFFFFFVPVAVADKVLEKHGGIDGVDDEFHFGDHLFRLILRA